MPADSLVEKHHLVSRGYQQNFADDVKRVAVVAAPSGAVVDAARPIKSNFTAPGYNTFVDEAGQPDATLEREYAKIEGPVADQLRRVTPDTLDSTFGGAIASHFAMHLVRSRSFLEMHEAVLERTIEEVVARNSDDPRVVEMYKAQISPDPAPGEIEAFIVDVLDGQRHGNRAHVDSQGLTYNKVLAQLARFRIQIITIGDLESGFVLGDVPVVHANTTDGRHGFRDKLAIGDADLIIGPLTRHTAVVLSAHPERHVVLSTKKKLQIINATFVRAARDEVACHPGDLRELRRVCQQLHRLPSIASTRR